MHCDLVYNLLINILSSINVTLYMVQELNRQISHREADWPTPQPVPRAMKTSNGEFCLHYCGREEQRGSTNTAVLPFNAEDVYTA